MNGSASPVPNPMAGIPPSPPCVPSPLDFDGLNDAASSAKRPKDTRWAAQQSETLQPVNFCSMPAHKASSNSLASSHPSLASFASTQTADSSTNLSPESCLFGRAANAAGAAAASAAPAHQAFQSSGGGNGSPAAQDRRNKRLERNRESARLSRKRRKAYLEELEQKVHSMSATMDSERVAFVLRFLGEVKRRFAGQAVASADAVRDVPTKPLAIKTGIKHNIHSLPPAATINSNSLHSRPTTNSNATRTRLPSALHTIYTFQHAHLSSLVISKEYKFVLWLMLQRESFWRGGRGNSERLSAARIGERLLHNGTYKAGPSGGMWPLLCHEVGLSYEQEDRVRSTQRAMLADPKTWLSRHTAAASKNVIDSMQTTITSMHETAKQRERSILAVLTPEQRSKFISWALRKANAIKNAAQSELAQLDTGHEYEITPERHVAANMYIVDHRLSKINASLVPAPPIIHPSRLKRLSRRPCFESLAGQDALENTKSNKLSREASFPSTGSLKRSLNELNGDDSQHLSSHHAHNGITVESAHAAAQPAVRAVFQDIMTIIPQSYQHQMHLQHFRAMNPTATNQATIPTSSPIITEPEALYAQSRVTSTIPTQQYHVPPPPSDDIDIPMPTPVSVLLQTNDEFLDIDAPTSGVPLEVTSTIMQPVESGFIPSIEYAPEPTLSSHGLSSRAHQSAPQLYTPDDFYPSMMPTVPEEGFTKSNNEDDGLDLDGLGDPNDWAIGESFDMDLDVGK